MAMSHAVLAESKDKDRGKSNDAWRKESFDGSVALASRVRVSEQARQRAMRVRHLARVVSEQTVGSVSKERGDSVRGM